MSSGGWPATGPRHGRHRRGSVNSAWTPVVRPTEAGHLPTHARMAWAPPPLSPPLSLPLPPPAASFSADADTSPLALATRPPVAQPEPMPRPAPEPDTEPAIVHVLPETPPRGLRKFDLGIVPASVTPPRTWRKAAWFAVGTSAAVVCGLAVAAVRLVGTPPAGDTIDALPAFPTQKLGTLPADETRRASETDRTRTSDESSPSAHSHPDTARRTGDASPSGSSHVPGSESSADSSSSTTGDDETTGTTGSTTDGGPGPVRTTVGPQPVTPTNPQAMGDRTEQYFDLVTQDPAAAHEMCTGGMARGGPEGIEARYAGVDHVEVQKITIDRNRAMTTSTVKVVHADGSETVEHRKLTFTWGGNPKISDDTAAG